jgi:hypothetical protein
MRLGRPRKRRDSSCLACQGPRAFCPTAVKYANLLHQPLARTIAITHLEAIDMYNLSATDMFSQALYPSIKDKLQFAHLQSLGNV